MKKFILYIFIAFLLLPAGAKAQFETFKDSVVQLYGIVMTADSLKGLEELKNAIDKFNRSNKDKIAYEQNKKLVIIL